jgi:hypothetical protein
MVGSFKGNKIDVGHKLYMQNKVTQVQEETRPEMENEISLRNK